MAAAALLLRIAGAAALCGAIPWLILSNYHPCDSAASAFGWSIYFLPALASILFSLPGLKARSCIAIGVVAVISISLAVGFELADDGMISPSGSQCEYSPIFGFMFAFVISSFILTVVLSILNVIYHWSADRRSRSN